MLSGSLTKKSIARTQGAADPGLHEGALDFGDELQSESSQPSLSLHGCLASIAEALPALLLVLKHWPHSRQPRTALRVQVARRSIESSTSGDVAGPQATQSHRRCLFCREACELGSCLDAERAVRVWQASRLYG